MSPWLSIDANPPISIASPMSRHAPLHSRFLAAWLAVALLLLAGCASAGAADSVYWANYTGGKISFASLAGGQGADLDITGANAEEANGLAIDPAAGRSTGSRLVLAPGPSTTPI
jgi:hypothetical protein